MEQWQAFFQQSLPALHEANAQTVKAVLDQWSASQRQMAQLQALVGQAWSGLMAQNPATDWPAAIDAYVAQLRQQMISFSEQAPSPQQGQELGQLYGQMAQKVSQPWFAFWSQAPQWFAQGATTPTAPWLAANQALAEALGQTWGGLLGAPTLGLQRQWQEKVQRWLTLSLENQTALREYQLLISQAWLNALAGLLYRLAALAQAGKRLDTPRQLFDLWVEVADAAFLELFHSAAYATAQGKLVNSNMALRQQQRELTEIWLRQHDLPTRSDLDEAHRNIYELRKEIKALKKALAHLPSPTPPEPAAPSKGRRGRRKSGG
jgi:polyhydroxyalkanoate synthase subunit PhaE